MKINLHSSWLPAIIFVPMTVLVIVLVIVLPGPADHETEWSVMKSPETGLCYEVVSVPRAADLVYPIAPELCDATVSGERKAR